MNTPVGSITQNTNHHLIGNNCKVDIGGGVVLKEGKVIAAFIINGKQYLTFEDEPNVGWEDWTVLQIFTAQDFIDAFKVKYAKG